MALSTVITKPITMVAGTDAQAADVNSDFDYYSTQMNTTNQEVNDHEAATMAHGVTGALVGTTSTQTLTNKTLVSPAVSDANLTGVPIAPTAALGTDTAQIATMAAIQQAAFAAANLPAQTGNAGKFVTTDGEAASWAALAPPSVIRSARTANTILGLADNTKLIDITSGTFTQTFEAAATLGSGWYCYLRNSGTGDITLDPNASELIDGLASYIMYPGECRLVQCDGVGFNTVVLNSFYKVFTTSGTFVKPPGYRFITGLGWSGGSSGRKSQEGYNSMGGAGGGCYPFEFSSEVFGPTEVITIGAGGASVTTPATDGNVGGATTIGSLYVVKGGANYMSGGALPDSEGVQAFVLIFSDYPYNGFAGASPGAFSVPTRWGGSSPSNDGREASKGSVYGGAAGWCITYSVVVQAAGKSKYGGDGGAAGISVSGTDGSVRGGGGGCTNTGAQSGAGGRGEIQIWGLL